jgi:hypothetical protein
MANSLICPSCGASAEPDGSAAYVKCVYCSSSISVAEFFKSSSTDTLSSLMEEGLSEDEMKTMARLFDGAENFIQLGEFENAKNNFLEILKISPNHLPSKFNLALCVLHSKEGTPIERAEKASKYISMGAEEYELVPELLKIRDSVAYNIASIGLSQTNSIETVKMFDISKDLIKENKDRDDLMNNYLKDLFNKMKGNFEKDLQKGKNNYCPNLTLLNMISGFSKNSIEFANLGASVAYHIIVNKKNMSSKVKDEIPNFKKTILERCQDNFISYDFGWTGLKEKTKNKSDLEKLQ